MKATHKRILLVGLLLGVLLEGLDGMVLGTAMPRIIADLDGLKLISWVFTAYILTSTLSTPIYGKLSDLYGRKQFYLGGMALFMVASMLAGQAQSIEWLIFWRGAQGLGAGAMMPVAASIASEAFPGPERGKIQGIISGGFGISSLVGPTLGGWITDGPGWRWAFYINVPLGLAVIAMLLFIKLPARERTQKVQVDYLGAATLMLFTTSLMLGFVFGGDETIGWGNLQTLAMFGIAVLSLAGFVVAERFAADPIIPLSFFKNKVFVMSTITVFLIGAAMFGAISYIAYFIQGVQGDSATSSGNTITPMMVALVIGTVVGGQGVTRLGKYRNLAIMFLVIITLGILQLVLLDVHSGTLEVVVAMITLGFGIGGTFPIFMIAMQNAFDPIYLGSISSLNAFFRQIGSMVGTSILGSILTSQLATEVPERLKQNLPAPAYQGLMAHGFNPSIQVLTSSEGLTALKSGLGNETLYNGVLLSLREALANSLHSIFIGALIIAVVALISTFFLKEIPLRWRAGKTQVAPQAVPAEQLEETEQVA